VRHLPRIDIFARARKEDERVRVRNWRRNDRRCWWAGCEALDEWDELWGGSNLCAKHVKRVLDL